MTFSEQENKRANPRRNLFVYLNVVDNDTQKPLGRIVDLTTGGMMLVGDSPLETNSSYSAKILLSGGLQSITMENIDVSFTTQWSKPDANPSLFVSGTKFKNLTPQTSRVIEQVIRKIGFEEEH